MQRFAFPFCARGSRSRRSDWDLGKGQTFAPSPDGKIQVIILILNDWNALTCPRRCARCRWTSTQVSKISNKNQCQRQLRMAQELRATDPHSHKIELSGRQKYMTITERERNFNLQPRSSQRVYNALEDKYAFAYFQSRSVQRHLKKLLKNVTQLSPSKDNRRVITSLSQKVILTDNNIHSESVETEKKHYLKTQKERGRTLTPGKEDIFYPYKEDLKLKPLQKIKHNLQRKERQLRHAQEKPVYFPRIKTTGDGVSHEKVMQKLIQRQEKILTGKQIMVSKFKHADFMGYLSKIKTAIE